MTSRGSPLHSGVLAGVRSGWRGFLWMAEIVIPVSLAVALLQWSGVLDKADAVLAPLMSFLRLPPEAAFPIISGMLVNIYAVLAALTVMHFSLAQMTLIAIFSLIAHNFILEGIVQHRSGVNVFRMTAVRLGAAIVTVFLVSRFFSGTAESVGLNGALTPHMAIPDVLKTWASSTGTLLLKIFGIIVLIMVALEISKAMGWMTHVNRVFKPLMKAFGLADRATTAFVAGIVFGLLYGGAVIVEEAKKGVLTRRDARNLQVTLAINHAMIEDPALFAALGVNLVWLIVPRLVTAIVAVQAIRGAEAVFGKRQKRTLDGSGRLLSDS